MKKCYNCRKEHKGKNILCKECLDKREKGELNTKGTPTLVIYDKM